MRNLSKEFSYNVFITASTTLLNKTFELVQFINKASELPKQELNFDPIFPFWIEKQILDISESEVTKTIQLPTFSDANLKDVVQL